MKPNTASWSRITALAIGYIVMLAGVLSIFSISSYASLAVMATGAVISLLSDRAKIPMAQISWIVLLTGCVLIYCMLVWFGEDRIRHWTPFPAGYIPAWIGCFYGFRHIRHLVLRHRHEAVAA